MDLHFFRSNASFLAAGMAANSAFGLFILLVCRFIGGPAYYSDVLLGETMVPILAGLLAIGTAVAAYLRNIRSSRCPSCCDESMVDDSDYGRTST